MAGTAIENLRDRRYPLSRLSKRQDGQDDDPAPLSLQQSAETMNMCSESNLKTIKATAREKSSFFRHALLLSKIGYPQTFQSLISKSEILLASLSDQFLRKWGSNVPCLSVCR